MKTISLDLLRARPLPAAAVPRTDASPTERAAPRVCLLHTTGPQVWVDLELPRPPASPAGGARVPDNSAPRPCPRLGGLRGSALGRAQPKAVVAALRGAKRNLSSENLIVGLDGASARPSWALRLPREHEAGLSPASSTPEDHTQTPLTQALQTAVQLASLHARGRPFSSVELGLLFQLTAVMGPAPPFDGGWARRGVPGATADHRGDRDRAAPAPPLAEVRRVGADPALAGHMATLGHYGELLLGISLDFAHIRSPEQLQEHVASILPQVIQADTCVLHTPLTPVPLSVLTTSNPVSAVRQTVPLNLLHPLPPHGFSMEDPDAHSHLSYRMECAGHLLGVLSFAKTTDDPDPFTAAQAHLADLLAEMVATCLLRLAGEWPARQGAALLGLARRLLGQAPADPPAVETALAEAARALTGCDRCVLLPVGDLAPPQPQNPTPGPNNDSGSPLDSPLGPLPLCLPVRGGGRDLASAYMTWPTPPTGRPAVATRSPQSLEPLLEVAGVALWMLQVAQQLETLQIQARLHHQALGCLSAPESDADAIFSLLADGIQELTRCKACCLYACPAVPGPDLDHDVDPSALAEVTRAAVEVARAPAGGSVLDSAAVRRALADLAEEAVRGNCGVSRSADAMDDDGNGAPASLGRRAVWARPVRARGRPVGALVLVDPPTVESQAEVLASAEELFGAILAHVAPAVLPQCPGPPLAPDGLRGAANAPPLDPAFVRRCLACPLAEERRAAVRTLQFDVFQPCPPHERVALLAFLFEDLGLLQDCGLDRGRLVRFLARASTLYGDTPYHNFRHAFDVAQMAYCLLRSLEAGPLAGALSPNQKLVLLAAAVVHDVDHGGLSNAFHQKVDTALGLLAGSTGVQAVMEAHHCRVALEVLSVGEQDVFHAFPLGERRAALRQLIGLILATDMSCHAAILEEFEAAVDARAPVLPELLLKMLMKSADLSNVVRPFPLARRWAECVTEEFLRQGDRERAEGLAVPAPLDRERHRGLAAGQLGFIHAVAARHFRAVALLDGPRLGWLVAQLDANTLRWQEGAA